MFLCFGLNQKYVSKCVSQQSGSIKRRGTGFLKKNNPSTNLLVNKRAYIYLSFLYDMLYDERKILRNLMKLL